MTRFERLVNSLMVIILLALAAETVYLVHRANRHDAARAALPRGRFAVRILRLGPQGESGPDAEARRKLILQALTGQPDLTREKADELLSRLPATVCRRNRRADAEALAQRLEHLGARVQLVDRQAEP